MKKIEIKSKLYNYTVNFVNDFAQELDNFAEHTTYIIDKNVYRLYRDKFNKIDPQKIYFMNPVEEYKNMHTVMEILSFWHHLEVRKNWKVICIGGGITQDVATIASNLYLRNIEWLFFPTTLLAMCDSCIGGKCGINLDGYKNQIGVFYPPRKIYIDTCFLKTLSTIDYINGWGELLKFSLTLDKEFYKEIKEETQYVPCSHIEDYIFKGLTVKKEIIEKDEFESDLRRVLNYGHTFGHALEAYTDNVISHGMAVLWGINVSNYFSWKEGLLSYEAYMDIKNFIKKEFIREEIEITDPDVLFEIIKTDKKAEDDILNFALLEQSGRLIIYPIKIDNALKERFKAYIMETHNEYHNH